VWNELNKFTGWVDVGLTERGKTEAREAGRLIGEEPALDLTVLHTSVLTRAVQTANLLLGDLGREWLPVRRSWRLNERHYGALQGLDKKGTAQKFGADQVKVWRRSYATPPPPLDPTNEMNPVYDPRYRLVPTDELPLTECLKDVVARMVPYWTDQIVPDLLNGPGGVLVVAHGNSIRALRKHLEGISDDEIVDLEIPTGVPQWYRLSDDLAIEDYKELGDPEAIAKAAEEVRRQSELPPQK
jgi:2,3-bisphosphoglycerate-dependent phosphoglycerate mutase